MKVISLLQPWASLVVLGLKKIETRSWDTKYRGEILIHASQKAPNKEIQKLMLSWEGKGFIIPNEYPLGRIIGKVEIVTTSILCSPYKDHIGPYGIYFNDKGASFNDQELEFGDYTAGRYGWLLANPVAFTHHFPVKGQLGIRDFNDPICLKCGCTQNDACITPGHHNCSWVKEGLCSACL